MSPQADDPRRSAVLAAFDDLADLDEPSRRERLAILAVSDPELHHAVEQLFEADSGAEALLGRFDAILGEQPQPSDPLRLTGRVISRYRVIEPLGRGGMGVVYRAEDTRLGRTIALKFPLTNRYIDPAAIQRFRNEARLAAALDHPNLCPVYEIDETPEGNLFYTMPLYPGETLKARLARDGRLPLTQGVSIAAQLADGLGAAHRAGIVHRDLKPGNVMLLPDGTVKILDFGLAKTGEISLTASSATLGTISYMAPEQINSSDADHRADLWAVGVLLYEMLTGNRPFTGGHEIGIAHAVFHDEPRMASALREDIPPELNDLIHRLLRKDPAERYQSAEELAESLRKIPLDQTDATRRELRSPGVDIKRSLPPRSFSNWRAWIIGAAVIVAAIGVALAARGRMTAPSGPVSIAVLPFDRLGDSAATHHLAVGISHGISSDLALLRNVVAPGYLSTFGYRQTTKSVRQIAAELNVGAVLRGSLQRINERVRVNAELVGAGDGKQLWQERYERPLSELPEIQRDIVLAAVSTMRIRTTSADREVLQRPATNHARAYDLYLRGVAIELEGRARQIIQPVPADNIRRAVSFYAQAREVDGGFAIARARLALAHTLSAATHDTTEARREQARLEAEAALRLRPQLPEAREALATYWGLRGDRARAIEQLASALKDFPNSGALHLAMGLQLARAGRRDEAVAEFDKAMKLEPGSARAAFLAALNYSRMRRREEGFRAFDRAVALAPDEHMLKVIRGQSFLRWKGTPDTLAAVMRTVSFAWDPQGMATYARFTAFFTQRRYADALAMLGRSRAELSRDRFVYEPKSLMRARVEEAMGQRQLAAASYGRARSVLEDSVDAHPTDPSIRISLGLANAGLGQTAEAIREARRAIELGRLAGDADGSTAVMAGAVEVFAKAGDREAAFELLELLFSMRAGREVTVPFIRAWPGFDPLRSDARLEELLVRFAEPP